MIYIELGVADSGDREKLTQQAQTEISKLSQEFKCISDISKFSLNDPAESKGVHGYSIGLAKTIQDTDKILDSL